MTRAWILDDLQEQAASLRSTGLRQKTGSTAAREA
jgi:hypothetical protein